MGKRVFVFGAEQLKHYIPFFNDARDSRALTPVIEVIKSRWWSTLLRDSINFKCECLHYCDDRLLLTIQNELDLEIIFLKEDIDARDYNGYCFMTNEIRITNLNASESAVCCFYQSFLSHQVLNQNPWELKIAATKLLERTEKPNTYRAISDYYADTKILLANTGASGSF